MVMMFEADQKFYTPTGTIAHKFRSFHLEPLIAPNGCRDNKKSTRKSG
jgi:hypothetical protein